MAYKVAKVTVYPQRNGVFGLGVKVMDAHGRVVCSSIGPVDPGGAREKVLETIALAEQSYSAEVERNMERVRELAQAEVDEYIQKRGK